MLHACFRQMCFKYYRECETWASMCLVLQCQCFRNIFVIWCKFSRIAAQFAPLVQFISYDKRLIIKIYTTCVFRHLKFPFIMTEVMTKHKYCIQDQIIINQNSPSARTLQALIITQWYSHLRLIWDNKALLN